MTLADIDAGIDAVFLPGKIHSCEWQVYIIYLNESANDGNGSFEIEIIDAKRILDLYVNVRVTLRCSSKCSQTGFNLNGTIAIMVWTGSTTMLMRSRTLISLSGKTETRQMR